MKKLIHDIAYSDIKIIELKLKRINFFKERLLLNKPNRLNLKKYKDWQLELKKLENEENKIIDELQEAYRELEKHL